MLGVAVSGGSRIYKGGGAQNNGCLLSLQPHIYKIITKTARWEVVKIVLLQKDLLGGGGGGWDGISCHFSHFRTSKATFQKGEGMCLKCPPLDPPMLKIIILLIFN